MAVPSWTSLSTLATTTGDPCKSGATLPQKRMPGGCRMDFGKVPP